MEAIILAYLLILTYLISALYFTIIKSLINRYKKFKCVNCTKCCKLKVDLTNEDIKRINTKINYIDNSSGKKIIKRINGYCIFLNIKEGKSKCAIYNMRPEICRNFPKTKIFGIKCNDSTCNGLKW